MQNCVSGIPGGIYVRGLIWGVRGGGGEMLILQGAGGMGAETVNVKGAEGGRSFLEIYFLVVSYRGE